MYEDKTESAIHREMLDATASDVDKRQGAITYDMTAPAAFQLSEAYIELDNVLAWGFVNEDGIGAFGELLDRRTGELGVTRKAAVKSAGSVTFSGTNGTIIPAGTEVVTESGVVFVTITAGTIASGKATVTAEAKVGGVSGNVGVGEITRVVGNLAGVTSVTNAGTFDGGVDRESDAALIARYFDRIRKPATSGNANHYLAWAKEVAGISDAKVYEVWDGPGTVKVVLLDDDKTAPSAEKVTEVSNYIESVRPSGANVTVTAAAEVAINVTATLTLASGATLGEATSQITAGLTAYLRKLAFVDPIVRYSQIANVILDAPSVVDYESLTVNGGAGNVVIADGSVAVPGSVTLT